LTGTDSVANYQAALRSVSYSFTPANGDPTGGGADTSRTIDWTVNDGVVNSTVATSTLSVVHEPPVVTAGASANYSGIGSPVTLDGGLNVNDPDSADDLTSATVQISSGFLAGDTLQVGTPEAGISAIYNPATGELALSGSASIAAYQTELESITYSSLTSDATNGGADTSRTITWTVGDGVSNSTPATSSLTVAPCYCRGARILTDRGEVAVEALRIGDLAITASGARRPIVWLGYRRLDLTRHNNPTAVWSVRVAANAFGEGLPHRDLWLSPGHNVASEGVLMPISSLINGQSVAQIKQSAVEYWHVELDAHDILIAEGLATESYLDCGNRAAFANGGAFIDAHPDFAPKYWAETCLPLIKQGPAVTATKARLLARLATEGHCIVREADAHIVVDGLRVEPFRASEMRLAFALPAGGQEIVLRSNVFVPAHTIDESVDSRELGLCVRKLQIDGSTAALDCDEACAAGWREAEYLDGNFARRWTTGATPLPAGSRGVIVDLAGVGYYWLTPAEQVAALSA
jgi:Hint domain